MDDSELKDFIDGQKNVNTKRKTQNEKHHLIFQYGTVGASLLEKKEQYSHKII